MVKTCPKIINFLFYAQNWFKIAQKKNLPKIKKFLLRKENLPNTCSPAIPLHWDQIPHPTPKISWLIETEFYSVSWIEKWNVSYKVQSLFFVLILGPNTEDDLGETEKHWGNSVTGQILFFG